jgi:hypothetical protein
MQKQYSPIGLIADDLLVNQALALSEIDGYFEEIRRVDEVDVDALHGGKPGKN